MFAPEASTQMRVRLDLVCFLGVGFYLCELLYIAIDRWHRMTSFDLTPERTWKFYASTSAGFPSIMQIYTLRFWCIVPFLGASASVKVNSLELFFKLCSVNNFKNPLKVMARPFFWSSHFPRALRGLTVLNLAKAFGSENLQRNSLKKMFKRDTRWDPLSRVIWWSLFWGHVNFQGCAYTI